MPSGSTIAKPASATRSRRSPGPRPMANVTDHDRARSSLARTRQRITCPVPTLSEASVRTITDRRSARGLDDMGVDGAPGGMPIEQVDDVGGAESGSAGWRASMILVIRVRSSSVSTVQRSAESSRSCVTLQSRKRSPCSRMYGVTCSRCVAAVASPSAASRTTRVIASTSRPRGQVRSIVLEA